jgi:hypothetical protein
LQLRGHVGCSQQGHRDRLLKPIGAHIRHHDSCMLDTEPQDLVCLAVNGNDAFFMSQAEESMGVGGGGGERERD